MTDMAESLTLARSPVRRYGVAVASVALALLLSIWAPTPLLEKHHSALFFIAVIVSTLYGGLGPGLVAIALATAGIEYFLVQPFQGVRQLPDDDAQPGTPEAAFVTSFVRVAVFAVSALLISLLNWRRLRAEVSGHLQFRLEGAEDVLRAFMHPSEAFGVVPHPLDMCQRTQGARRGDGGQQ